MEGLNGLRRPRACNVSVIGADQDSEIDFDETSEAQSECKVGEITKGRAARHNLQSIAISALSKSLQRRRRAACKSPTAVNRRRSMSSVDGGAWQDAGPRESLREDSDRPSPALSAGRRLRRPSKTLAFEAASRSLEKRRQPSSCGASSLSSAQAIQRSNSHVDTKVRLDAHERSAFREQLGGPCSAERAESRPASAPVLVNSLTNEADVESVESAPRPSSAPVRGQNAPRPSSTPVRGKKNRTPTARISCALSLSRPSSSSSSPSLSQFCAPEASEFVLNSSLEPAATNAPKSAARVSSILSSSRPCAVRIRARSCSKSSIASESTAARWSSLGNAPSSNATSRSTSPTQLLE